VTLPRLTPVGIRFVSRPRFVGCNIRNPPLTRVGMRENLTRTQLEPREGRTAACITGLQCRGRSDCLVGFITNLSTFGWRV